VTFLRLSAVAIVFAASLSCFSQDGTAQTFNTVSITIEPDWPGGYMGLGGGLVKSIVKPAEENHADNDDKPAASRNRLRRARATHASRAGTPATNNVTPIAIVARTLDHTGYNISGVGWQTEPR
jgi:hypothetical protein